MFEINDLQVIFGIIFSIIALSMFILFLVGKDKKLYFVLMLIFVFVSILSFIQTGLFIPSLAKQGNSTTSLDIVGSKSPIDVVKYNFMEKNSGDRNVVNGVVRLYRLYNNVNYVSIVSSEPSSSTLIINGSGIDTSKKLLTDTDYMMLFEGSGYYDMNLSSVRFNKTNSLIQQQVVSINNVAKIGVIGELINPDRQKDYFNNNILNLSYDNNTPVITYNVSTEGNVFRFPIIVRVTGDINSEVHNLGIVALWDKIEPPEGNEYLNVYFINKNGDDSLINNTNYISWWKGEGVIPLGDVMGSGVYAEYEVVITLPTSKELVYTNGDIWQLCVDDLSYSRIDNQTINRRAMKGDIFGNDKAKGECIIIKAKS